MARAAAKGGGRAKQDARRAAAAQRPQRSGRRQLSPTEQTLFFSRIRTHAKWVFVLLALVFAGGFVFFGVGSGSNGAGSLGDLFNNIFNGGSGGPSISKSLKATEKNPNDAKAWKDLATAYTSKGDTQDAINAWTSYVSLRPKDATSLGELATLQVQQAQNYSQDALNAQGQQAFDPTLFQPSSSSKLGQGLGQDPITQAVQSQTTTAASDAQGKATTAYQQALTTYLQLTKVTPKDVSVRIEAAQTAEAARNYRVAIQNYEKAAQLDPAQASQLRARIKQLQPFAATSSG